PWSLSPAAKGFLSCLLSPKADINRGERYVCFVPTAEVAPLLSINGYPTRPATGPSSFPRLGSESRA
ncbi:MAG: hypothetical protein WA767_03510, partial [Pseudolabrys sp.]